MGTITLQQAADWCGGKIDPKYKDITFFGANNDTRKLQPGQLFLALQGVRDGHDFIPAALERGAAAVLCTHCDGDYPAIVVEDTRVALGNIARGARQQRPPVGGSSAARIDGFYLCGASAPGHGQWYDLRQKRCG